RLHVTRAGRGRGRGSSLRHLLAGDRALRASVAREPPSLASPRREAGAAAQAKPRGVPGDTSHLHQRPCGAGCEVAKRLEARARALPRVADRSALVEGVGVQWDLPGTVARRDQSHTLGVILTPGP